MTGKDAAKNASKRFWNDKERQVRMMLDHAVYAPTRVDYVKCGGCKQRLARILSVDGAPAFEIFAPVHEEGGVWVLEQRPREGGRFGRLTPDKDERIRLRCAACRHVTEIDTGALRVVLDSLGP